jgi:hypothetical protein
MRKIFLLAASFVIAFTAMSQTSKSEQNKSAEVVRFNTEKHDFGKIKQGNPVNFYFELTNASDKPIVVESTQATCGCTTPEKPEGPIMPGATGKIKVVFNAAAVGPFNKSVTIKLAGIDTPKMVHINGEVLTPEAYDEYLKTLPKETKPNN